MINTYFSGAGIIYLAKYDEGGKLSSFKDVGNVPFFSFSRYGNWEERGKQDTIKIIFENFNEETFDLIFGGYAKETTVDEFSNVGEFKQKYKDTKVLVTPITTSREQRPCALVFEGFNIANGNKERIRLELNNISLRPAKTVVAINTDELAQFECTGIYTVHTNDKAFYLVDGEASDNVIPLREKPAARKKK